MKGNSHMLSKPLVSVVIPTYNYAHYLPEAIDSIVSQTYKNLEILVIDDGSTDNTKAVMEKYKQKVRYLYKQNGGLSSARNYGLTKITGDYVLFVDADNKIRPSYIAKALKLLVSQTDDVGFAYTQLEYFEAMIISQPIPPMMPRN